MPGDITEPRFTLDDGIGYVYEAMAEHLIKRIADGELVPGEPLPCERRLAYQYGVALGTARHATRLLRFRGLVVTIRSKGSYVAKDALETAQIAASKVDIAQR
ncbi:winged helix-turn-helix transcriptional regulator [Amycolatopsis acidicola]|uniref:Winged helix-turn-helix transcriptional regulator n=2 Tax=Amycolatopsis acidicola TaxID=2596893 RepID=A0A5N0UZK3_9PSEU|nr:winged helix-turn-helix transcriptional regulator [Amycolatopsis acidicola]